MNKTIRTIGVIALLLMAMTSIASAETLGLTQKTTGNWLPYGMTATLTYNEEGATFDYIVDGTVPLDKEYSLIYYADIVPTGSTTPGVVGKIIAVATPIGGVIHMEGSRVMSSIPYPEDANSVSTANDENPGAKIWLVPSDNIILGTGTTPKTLNWANFPSGYLFEENMNAVDDTIVVTNGVPSHLITYTYLASTSLIGNAEVVACPVGTIGLSINTPNDLLDFGQLYPGQSSLPQDASIIITASDFVNSELGTSCEEEPEHVSIFVSVEDWNGLLGNTMASESTEISGDLNEDGTLNEDYMFTPGMQYELPIGETEAYLILSLSSDAVPDTYTQIITVTQIS